MLGTAPDPSPAEGTAMSPAQPTAWPRSTLETPRSSLRRTARGALLAALVAASAQAQQAPTAPGAVPAPAPVPATVPAPIQDPDGEAAEPSEAEQQRLGLLAFALAVKLARPEAFGEAEGVLVTQVLPNSQAEGAGLQPGDILLRYNDTPLSDAPQLVAQTRESTEDQPVTLHLLRLGEPMQVAIHGGRMGTGVQGIGDPRAFDTLVQRDLLRNGARILQRLDRAELAERMHQQAAALSDPAATQPDSPPPPPAQTAQTPHADQTPAEAQAPTPPEQPSESEQAAMILAGLALAQKIALPDAFGDAKGVVVIEVMPGSQAEAAGLEPGDILLRYDGTPLDSVEQLVALTGEHGPERHVQLQLLRLGQRLDPSLRSGRIGVRVTDMLSPARLQLPTRDEPYSEARLFGARLAWHRFFQEGDFAAAFFVALSMRERVEQMPDVDAGAKLRVYNSLALSYQALGRYDDAAPLFHRAIEQGERVLGADHRDTLTYTSNLGLLYKDLGRYTEAELLLRRALEGSERALGTEDPDTLTSVNNLAALLDDQGRYAEAESLYSRVLAAREHVFGADHPNTLISVNNLAHIYFNQGRYAKAEPLLRRVLTTRERLLGEDHLDTILSVNNLAVLHKAQGRYGEAESLSRQALTAYERVLGKEHPDTLTSVNNLAGLYEAQGRYGEAEPLFRRALLASERVLGEEHPDTLRNVNNLAALYDSQGRYSEAEPLFRRALSARERVLGEEHPDTLESVTTLAGLYSNQGRYGEAEPLYRRALSASEGALGEEHPQTILSINNLAGLYADQGRYGEAEPLYRRGLTASERVLGEEHPDTLIRINNLALLYQSQGRYGEAEALHRRALAAIERVLGEEHPDTLTSVNNLAALYQSQGRYGEAEALHRRALAAIERVLGEEHPDTLTSVNNLAALYQSQGRYGEAEPLYRRALAARERVLGGEHPGTIRALINLATLFAASGQDDAFREALVQWDDAARSALALALSTTRGPRVRRLYLADSVNPVALTCSRAVAGRDQPNLSHLCTNLHLRWKRLGSAEAEIIARVVRTTDDPKVRELAIDIATARANLAGMIHLPEPDVMAIAQERERLEELESQLAQRSQDFRAEVWRAETDWRQVSAALPADGVLLDLRRFRPFDFKSGEWGDARWLAVLIRPGGDAAPTPEVIDLGPAAATDAAVEALLSAASREARNTAAAELYQALIAPVAERLADAERVFLSPDGRLDLVPFAALRTGDGGYWIERKDLRVVRTGRDLLPLSAPAGDAAKGLVALGGIDYARFADSEPRPPAAPDALAKNASRSLLAGRIGLVAPDPLPAGEADTEDAGSGDIQPGSGPTAMRFEPLEATAPEARALQALFTAARSEPSRLLTGTAASEAALQAQAGQQATPPRILHLATHGFFRPARGSTAARPLTLAGLALAGANRGMQGEHGPSGDDGILTALEAQDLNLAGTELVTLSACDTGKGEIDAVEGVYGLVRSFQLAGARNVLTTLWQLDDALAAEFMTDFYRTWLADNAHDEPAQALRATQLAWIGSDDERKSDPYYWAPYVVVERR
jgi:CHAT domain-containing protein/tetratricopeptide (TPR) repeat protein